MRNKRISSLTRLLLLTGLTGCLSSCYTQLLTRGYGERSLEQPDAAYARPSRPAADTLKPSSHGPELDSSVSTIEDSAARAADEGRSSTVIVNNYYQDSPYYRGYSTLDWDYPYISFGFYSSRYRDYWDPYWWHGGGRRGYYGGDRRHYDQGYVHGGSYGGNGAGGTGNGAGGTGNGAYHSDKRLFTPAPAYPAPQKGRRSEQAPAQPASAQPAPKSGSDSGSQSSVSTKAGESRSEESHPTLQKGRRR